MSYPRWAVAGLLSALASPAFASCEQSFDVDPAKTLASIVALLAMPESGERPVSCVVAERYREFLFLDGATRIDNKALDNLQALKDAAALQRKQLKKAIEDAEPNSARILVDVALLQYGKYSTIISCFAPEPTASKIACGIGLGSAILGTFDLANNASKATEMLQIAKSGLEANEALYDELQSRTDSISLPIKARRDALYTAMCTSIQSLCLK